MTPTADPPPALARRPTSPAELEPAAAAKLRELIREGTPDNTIRARAGDRRRFWDGVDLAETYPVPLAVILGWIATALERYAVATVERTVRTLSRAHHAAGIPAEHNPCRAAPVRETLRAAKVRNAKRGRRQRQAAAVKLGDVRRMIATCAADVPGAGVDAEPVWTLLELPALRDRAILWTLYASGMRRSELAALDVADLEQTTTAGELAYRVTIRRSKSDQTGEGRVLAFAGEAAEALADWLREAAITSGPVFRGFYKGGRRLRPGAISDKAVETIVAARAERAGLEHRTPHGLRAGFATDAVEAGIPAKDVMSGRWRSLPAFARYTRGREALANPAAYLTASEGIHLEASP